MRRVIVGVTAALLAVTPTVAFGYHHHPRPMWSSPSASPSPTRSSTPTPSPSPSPSRSSNPSSTPTVSLSPSLTPSATPSSPLPTLTATSSPTATASPSGEQLVFDDEFSGTTVGSAWSTYTGTPGGDPTGEWLPSHVVEGGGYLTLKGYEDPSTGKYATGGVGLWNTGQPITYGEVDVRFEADAGNGVALAFLLWPYDGQWPPEVDFAEDGGGDRQTTTATLHYGSSNSQIQDSVSANFTTWQTIGVRWSPGELQYLLNGQVWATVTNVNVPSIPMVPCLQDQADPASAYSEGVTAPNVETDIRIDWIHVYQEAS